MELYVIETGNLKYDGGAMFGVVPKALWSKVYPCDENNMSAFSMRSLLVVDEDRKILIDTGMGDKLPEKITRHYHPFGVESLENGLEKAGVKAEEITDVVMTHLHFDHCGGSVKFDNETGKYIPAFPNATYWVGKEQYELGLNPSSRDGASYFKNNFVPLLEAGKLNLIEKEGEILPNIEARLFHGHTDGQLIPIINFNGNKIIYGGDLIPTSAHFAAAWVMAYDNYPLKTMEETQEILNEAYEGDYLVFFEHDLYTQCATVNKTDKGFRPGLKLKLQEWIDQL